MIESAAARRRGRGSPGVETVAATADSDRTTDASHLSTLGRASTRTADPALADDARPTTCPVCLTDLDDCGYCNCCARVFT